MSEQKDFRIVIVGAGLAGLAAAIGMRGEGRQITILESSRMKSEVGAAIHLAPNAVKICSGWGLDVEKAAKATVCRGLSEISADNVTRFSMPMDPAKFVGANWLLNHRVDLHNAFRDFATKEEGTGSPAKIIAPAKVVSVDCAAGIVKTEDGQTYEADLVVGADGIHSPVREAVLGAVKVAQPSGHSAYRALILKDKLLDIPEIQNALDHQNGHMKMIVDMDRRVILYPCREGTILNVVAICPDSLMNETATQSWQQEGKVEEMVKAYANFPEWLRTVLSRADKCGLWSLRDQDPLDTWVSGRCIIIGDSAHAMLPHQGQGAGQGVEDGEALGAYFEDVHGPISAEEVNKRLQQVFSARIERASTIQQYSRQQARPPKNKEDGIALDAQQFSKYNWSYKGAKEWVSRTAAASA